MSEWVSCSLRRGGVLNKRLEALTGWDRIDYVVFAHLSICLSVYLSPVCNATVDTTMYGVSHLIIIIFCCSGPEWAFSTLHYTTSMWLELEQQVSRPPVWW
ncbi:hypothetical protein F5X96DRAFT_642270 [Biscogniauxia mediterranea]|nr:hypothetical protein F5X96DRAFT_642270 [Biscogniauxia mediterranea]